MEVCIVRIILEKLALGQNSEFRNADFWPPHNGILPLTAPLGRVFDILSSLQRVASWSCFENTDFTQLGFTDNLDWKGEDINKNQLNTLLGCRTETINRQIIVWV